jgi:serine protease
VNQRGLKRVCLAAAILLAVAAGAPAQAASGSTAGLTSSQVSGLIVHYAQGSTVSLGAGAFLGQPQLSANGFSVQNSQSLGDGWHSLKFVAPVTQAAAEQATTVLESVNGVLAAYPDQTIAPSAVPVAKTTSSVRNNPLSLISKFFSAQALKSATSVRNVRVADGWTANQPSTATLKASWLKPLSVFGAKIAGYRIQVSIDGGKTVLYSATQNSSATRALLNREVTPGQPVSVRIAALTKLSGVVRVGKFSAWATGEATTIPQVPKFITEPKATVGSSPHWHLLSAVEQGGLAVTYEATASLGKTVVDVCKTESDTCFFTNLQQGVFYSVSLKAINARGFSTSFNAAEVTDPMFQYQWALGKVHGVNAESAWTRTTGEGVVVAVIDSGISEHPDLAGQLLRNTDGSVYGYDFITNSNNAQDGDGRDPNPTDPNGGSSWHGTHVSGIIAAAANGTGVVGVAPGAKLLELRALGANGGVESDLIAALHWAAGVAVPGAPENQHPAKVINLSLGYVNNCDQATTAVLQSLHAAGVSVVTAAGNDNSYASISYPGNCVPTINVGASNFSSDRASYSNYGASVDISAPGGDQQPSSGAPMLPGSSYAETGMILSTLNDGQDAMGQPSYGYEQGTSMAAPYVTGVIALIYSARPDFTPDLVWEAIKATATVWDPNSQCFAQATVHSCGAGIINAGEAVTWALSHS